MNKEQTPITAWEFYENSDTANVYDVMEQYAQYREKKAVLEVIESRRIKDYDDGYNEGYDDGASGNKHRYKQK